MRFKFLKMLKLSFFSILLLEIHITYCNILEDPKSEYVIQGNYGTFQCVGRGDVYWWVVSTKYVDAFRVNEMTDATQLTSQGFRFEFRIKDYSDHYLSLSVLASIDNNNTEIYCEGTDGSRSLNASLIVEGPPTPSGVRLENYNATTLLLSWERPFTWPNFSIALYNVSVTVNGYDTTVNATPKYSMMVPTPSGEPVKACLEVLLTVAVVSRSSDGREFVREENITGGFPIVPAPVTELSCSILTDSETDETPKLNISFNMPTLCSYGSGRANYTIVIQIPGSSEMTLITNDSQSNHTVNELIGLGQWFLIDENYSVTVTVATAAGSSDSGCVVELPVPKEEYIPKETVTHLTNDGQTSDKERKSTNISLVIGITLGGLSVILIIFIIGIMMLHFFHKHLKQSAQREITTTQPSLIPNPIYEGPLYETIENQLNTLTPDLTKHEAQFTAHDTDEHTQTDGSENNDDVRYLKNPVHFTRDALPSGPQLQCFLAFLDTASESSVDSPDSTCSLLHVASNSPQGMRDDHPPLPKLATQGMTSGTGIDPLSVTSEKPKSDESGVPIQQDPQDGHVDDNYTVMSPATDTGMFTGGRSDFAFSFPPSSFPTCSVHKV